MWAHMSNRLYEVSLSIIEPVFLNQSHFAALTAPGAFVAIAKRARKDAKIWATGKGLPSGKNDRLPKQYKWWKEPQVLMRIVQACQQPDANRNTHTHTFWMIWMQMIPLTTNYNPTQLAWRSFRISEVRPWNMHLDRNHARCSTISQASGQEPKCSIFVENCTQQNQTR